MWLTAMAASSPLRSLTPSKSKPLSNIILSLGKFHTKSTRMEISEIEAEKKKIFVSGATGKTGKRIVEQLLAKGFAVKAGVRDADKAKSMFPNPIEDLQFVRK
ncbi:putative NAD(P)-binding domain, NAD(P)-binding domain superfamily [Helianthus annuus]|nr:putative NAD(P)-binding domain, NAD(P)-binding domain superfamily [Helianthus annuus]